MKNWRNRKIFHAEPNQCGIISGHNVSSQPRRCQMITRLKYAFQGLSVILWKSLILSIFSFAQSCKRMGSGLAFSARWATM